MGKYKFSMQVGSEVFSIDNCDSFEEAIGKVEKGVYDRKLQKEREEEKRKSVAAQALMEQGEDADKAVTAVNGKKTTSIGVKK